MSLLVEVFAVSLVVAAFIKIAILTVQFDSVNMWLDFAQVGDQMRCCTHEVYNRHLCVALGGGRSESIS